MNSILKIYLVITPVQLVWFTANILRMAGILLLFTLRRNTGLKWRMVRFYGYDHLILKLEWARPNTPKDPASSGTEFRSGYGKALAQDTKEKVSYASNLTK